MREERSGGRKWMEGGERGSGGSLGQKANIRVNVNIAQGTRSPQVYSKDNDVP